MSRLVADPARTALLEQKPGLGIVRNFYKFSVAYNGTACLVYRILLADHDAGFAADDTQEGTIVPDETLRVLDNHAHDPEGSSSAVAFMKITLSIGQIMLHFLHVVIVLHGVVRHIQPARKDLEPGTDDGTQIIQNNVTIVRHCAKSIPVFVGKRPRIDSADLSLSGGHRLVSGTGKNIVSGAHFLLGKGINLEGIDGGFPRRIRRLRNPGRLCSCRCSAHHPYLLVGQLS